VSGNKREKKRAHTRKPSPAVTSVDRERLLTEARELLSFGQPDKTLALVVPIAETADGDYDDTVIEARCLAAVASLRLRRIAEAEKLVALALELCPRSLEAKMIQVLIHAEMGEYDECLQKSDLVRDDLGAYPDTELSDFAQNLMPQFYGALGLAHYNAEQFEQAVQAYRDGISLKNDLPELHIGLSRVYAATGDESGERQVLSEGLVHCADKTELQMLAERFLGEESISLCMIVKNEEEFLGRCLESVKGLVKEIIVVDTGSEDNTIKIAENYGAKVYHHPWENNFSLHRNQSISYATGDWILVLDADEELCTTDHDKLRAATRIPDMNAISISVYNKNLKTGEITSFLTSTRLWRRKLNIKYAGIVHNELQLPRNEAILRADVRLWHYGYSLEWERMKKKIARTKALLQQQLRENPNNPFTNFNYSQLLRGESKQPSPELCREIIEHSGRTVDNTDPGSPAQRHLHVSALDQISAAHFYLKEFDKAAEASLQALQVDPHYVDPKFNLGHIYAAKHDYEKAITAFNEYLDFVNNYDPGHEINNYILMHANKQAEAHYGLGLVYEQMREDEKAIANFLKTLGYKNDYLDTHTHLARLYYNSGQYDIAREHAEARVRSDSLDLSARFILGEICRRDREWAGAVEHYDAILAEDSTDMASLLGIVESFHSLGNNEQLLYRVEQLLDGEPGNCRALTLKAEALMAMGQFRIAVPIYERACKLQPGNAELRNNLGNCHYKLSEFAPAIEHYRIALALDRSLTLAMRNVGLAYFKLDDRDQALEYLTEYLNAARNDFDILYLVARLYFDNAEYAEAINYLEKCLKLKPESAQLVAFLADCYLKLGHVDSARLGYEQALKIDPAFEPAAAMLEQLEKVTVGELEP
jgi:tetratricopeptide (TPR) repeat protein